MGLGVAHKKSGCPVVPSEMSATYLPFDAEKSICRTGLLHLRCNELVKVLLRELAIYQSS